MDFVPASFEDHAFPDGRIDTIDDLEAIYDAPSEAALIKEADRVVPNMRG
jgi:hypothetical protein